MERKQQIFAILVILMLLMLSCILFPSNDNPAPGCNESFGMGGCFGKTVLQGLTVDPHIDCLDIEANNCNGGVLDVRNSCDEILILEGIEIPPSAFMSFDVNEGENGFHSLIEVSHNFSEYFCNIFY